MRREAAQARTMEELLYLARRDFPDDFARVETEAARRGVSLNRVLTEEILRELRYWLLGR